MNATEVKNATKKSVKWSLLGEIFAKIATPLSTMVLARLLSPEIYGIATAVTLVVTFCETVTENGFSKFVIQHDFESEEEYKKYFSISMYTSIMLSLIMCAIVFVLRAPLSSAVGNAGYEMVLAVSCVQIPFAAINALYSANLRRQFSFKRLFYIRIVYCAVPFIVTIPLAIAGLGYWSLVIGAIAGQIFETPFLYFACRGKIKLFFSFKKFVEIFKLSFPMILESIIIWLCTWTGTILAANFFDSSTVGIVKVSSSTVNSIFALFATAFTSVLFPALSRLKDNKDAYEDTFYSIQGAALSILVPLGVGVYFYSQLVTDIFLGSKWGEAAFVIGIFSLTRPLMICFNNFMSEVFRSKGHFYSSIFYQLAMLTFDILLKFTLGKVSYEWFIWTTVIANLFTTLLAISILKIRYKFSIAKQWHSFLPTFVASLFMIPLVLLGVNSNANTVMSIAQIVSCAILYFVVLFILFPKVFNNSISFFIKRKE